MLEGVLSGLRRALRPEWRLQSTATFRDRQASFFAEVTDFPRSQLANC
jgi:hypothetical protein